MSDLVAPDTTEAMQRVVHLVQYEFRDPRLAEALEKEFPASEGCFGYVDDDCLKLLWMSVALDESDARVLVGLQSKRYKPSEPREGFLGYTALALHDWMKAQGLDHDTDLLRPSHAHIKTKIPDPSDPAADHFWTDWAPIDEEVLWGDDLMVEELEAPSPTAS